MPELLLFNWLHDFSSVLNVRNTFGWNLISIVGIDNRNLACKTE